MRHTRLWCSRLLLIAAMGLLLTTCTGKESTEVSTVPPQEQVTERAAEQTPEPVTIRFLTYDWEQDFYRDIVEAFTEANSNVRIQFVALSELTDLDARPIMWPNVPAVADVFRIDMVGVYEGFTGRLRDLTPFIEADADFQPEDFYPGILESYRWQDGTWAVPVGLDVQLIAYHKGIFDTVGVAYPEAGWTWKDMAAKARALTEHAEEDEQVKRWGFVLSPFLADGTLIEGRVGPLIDHTSDPPMPRLDRPEVIEAVRWYTDLCAESVITQPMLIDSRMLYGGRMAAMWTETFSSWSGTYPRTNVGLAPFPVDTPDAQSTPLRPLALAMSAGTRHPDAAWRWIEFLSRQDISRMLVRYIPARRSVAEASVFWEGLDAETAAVLEYALQHSYPYVERDREDGRWALSHALEAILAGDRSVEEALAEAQAQAIENLREERERRANATPVPPFSVGEVEQQRPPEGAVAITFAGADYLVQQRYLDLVARFRETHPDIVVMIAPGRLTPTGLAELAQAADCFLASPDLRRPQDREAVLSLRPFLDADPSYPADDFYPAALPPFTWQGDLRGLPAELVPYVVEFNRDLFDAARVAYPRPNWTYDEFVERAIALTKGEGEGIQYGFVPEPFADYALPLILERWGADLLDERQRPPAPTLDSPATVAALRRYTDLALVHRVQPAFALDLDRPGGEALTEWESLIRNGRAAMWMVSSSQSAYLRTSRAEHIGVAPLPASGGSNGYVQAKGYFISAQSRAPQACWEWLKFLSAQPDAVEGLPARRSVAESPAYRQRVGDERAEAYLAAVRDVNPHSFTLTVAQHPWLRGIEFWLFRAYVQAVNGEASVEAALAETQDLADAYRACVITRDALYEREGWEACLREVDPTLPPSLFGTE